MIDRGELAAVRIGKRRVRVRQSELDAVIEAGQVRPVDPQEARQAFHEALEEAHGAENDADLATALRSLSRTSAALARALSKSQSGQDRQSEIDRGLLGDP
jgi:hypothetical protein